MPMLHLGASKVERTLDIWAIELAFHLRTMVRELMLLAR